MFAVENERASSLSPAEPFEKSSDYGEENGISIDADECIDFKVRLLLRLRRLR